MKEEYLTEEGLKKLKDELAKLLFLRKEIVERLKEAKIYGDITENSEYEDAKNEQAFIEGRIRDLEEMIKKAKIIQKPTGDKISLGSKVKVKINSQEGEFTIVGSREADPENGLISSDSPLGQALIGRGKGDKVEVETPSGKVKYKIISVE